MVRKQTLLLPLVLLLALSTTGCSIRRYAINKIGDALAEGGSTYESDDDIQLVGEALPFGLKLIESLLAESPEHKGLLTAAAQGFTTYAYVFVQRDADLIADEDLDAARQIRLRARRLYLRAHRYGLRGLEVSHPGIAEPLRTAPETAVAVLEKKDLPLIYWTAAALGSAISVGRNDASMLARLPEVEALLDRAIQLDEGWQDGLLHEFQVVFASARPGAVDYEKIRRHFERALDLSDGTHAALYVAYAEAVCVPKQDSKQFRAMLDRALAIDPDETERIRLANLIAQERARYLLAHIEDLILETEAQSTEGGVS